MRHSRPAHNTTSLPRQLREELGLKDSYGQQGHKRHNRPASRKEKRKAERSRKPTRLQFGKANQGPRHRAADEDEDNDLDDLDDLDDDAEGPNAPDAKVLSERATGNGSKLKSIPRKSKKEDLLDEGSDGTDTDEEDLDTARSRKISEAVKAKLAQDDAEIAALEKKLGIKKGKKLPKAFEEDGLDGLLGELGHDSGDDSRKRKREADEWLRNKRLKAQRLHQVDEDAAEDDGFGDLLENSEDDLGDLDDNEDYEHDDDMENSTGDGSQSEDEQEDDVFEGFGDATKPKEERENPYVAPASAKVQPGKYVPPSLRGEPTSETESLVRLRRQAQGLLNKLSEANLVSILGKVEKLYRDYPRHSVTSTLINLLLGLVVERSALQDTFIILHGGFIAAIYKVIGMDVGAELVQNIVETLDAAREGDVSVQGKEKINLISLLSQLYNFHVVGSTLVFDYIRIFVQEISETNTELLLKIIKNSGPQLRQDDPCSLKDIVLLLQPAIAKVGEASLSVRTKFMIDSITDLKNNRTKANAGSTIASEHITKMRKILGSLNTTRVLRATEPMRISRADIHNSSKKGKWWLVGASWKEDPLESARQELSSLPPAATGLSISDDADDDSEAEPDLARIAKAHRMNTDVRRSIFVAIMSATDYQDAHVRLLKLRLKRAQEFEIPRVLLHCAMQEAAYNPYYTLIARRLCGEMGRRIKVSFTYALWNMFRKMGERDEDGLAADDEDDVGFDADADDSEEPDKMTAEAIVNLAKMYGDLVVDGMLTLAVVKNLNFAYLMPKTRTFMELFMITIFQQVQKKNKNKTKKIKKNKNAREDHLPDEPDMERELDEKALVEIFLPVRDMPQVAKGLIYFLRRVVAKTDVVWSDNDLKLIRWACGVAVDALLIVTTGCDT